ncbi:hypothetical protein J6590_002475 [Homalodisca vitripennis]|nr:hypothetical protein J6590_002475 [Homalodisca vitripennis]
MLTSKMNYGCNNSKKTMACGATVGAELSGRVPSSRKCQIYTQRNYHTPVERAPPLPTFLYNLNSLGRGVKQIPPFASVSKNRNSQFLPYRHFFSYCLVKHS